MTLTAAQVRQARALLRFTSPRLSRVAGVSFDTALKASNKGKRRTDLRVRCHRHADEGSPDDFVTVDLARASGDLALNVLLVST